MLISKEYVSSVINDLKGMKLMLTMVNNNKFVFNPMYSIELMQRFNLIYELLNSLKLDKNKLI